MPVAGIAGAVAVLGIVTLMHSWSLPPAGIGRVKFPTGVVLCSKGFNGHSPVTVLTAGAVQELPAYTDECSRLPKRSLFAATEMV